MTAIGQAASSDGTHHSWLDWNPEFSRWERIEVYLPIHPVQSLAPASSLQEPVSVNEHLISIYSGEEPPLESENIVLVQQVAHKSLNRDCCHFL